MPQYVVPSTDITHFAFMNKAVKTAVFTQNTGKTPCLMVDLTAYHAVITESDDVPIADETA